MNSHVFDTTALSHFARAGRMDELRMVSVNGGVAIIDEVSAQAIGGRERLQVHGSLWLLIRSFKNQVHDRATVGAIVEARILP